MTIDPVFARNPKEAERLAGKHMLVVGVGSVGSPLIDMAARSGVGHFTLVDPDALSLENVGRHMLSRDSVGQSKVRAMKRAIKAINPAAVVHAIARDFTTLSPNSLSNGSRPDLIVADTDSFQCQSFVNGVSLEEHIPAVYVGCWGEASVGEVLYVIPGATPCFECYAGFRSNTERLPVDDPRRYIAPGPARQASGVFYPAPRPGPWAQSA